MRRLTLLLLAVSLAATAVPAQAQELTFGVRGGLNVATADVKGDLFTQDVGTRTGFHGGILGYVDIGEWFAIQTEVMYSQKGFAKGNGDVSLSVDYFEIPLLAVFKLRGKISPHLYAGAVLGLENNCKVASGDTKAGCDEVIAENLGLPRTKGADSGLMFGLGVEFDVGFAGLLLDAMYNYGLTDIAEPSEEIDSIKTRTFYLSAGLVWPIGRAAG
jgi:hypothetical protein